ncbi:MAG: hypothetical protein RLZZ292_730 [Bacteroidota bacterium]
MQKIFFLLLGLFFLTFSLSAQVGGNHIFEFLNAPNSARASALGGMAIATKDDDVAVAYQNPSALNTKMDKALSFNLNRGFGGTSNGYLGFGKNFLKIGMTLHGGIQFMNYGTFNNTNEYGKSLGEFSGKENAFVLGAGKQLGEYFSIGTNLKFVTSTLGAGAADLPEGYNATGILADVAAMYHNPETQSTFTIVANNAGRQLSTYNNTLESIPFRINVGYSKRLKHLPFRLSILFHDLQRWDIRYNDPNKVVTNSFISDATTTTEKPKLDNLARHLTLNGEFLLGQKENFRLRFGYNHLSHRELSVDNYRSVGGFSVGFGMKINRFRLDFARSIYNLAGGTNHFSFSTNINEFLK